MNFTKSRNVTWFEFCFQKHMICQESPPSPLLPPRPPTHVQYCRRFHRKRELSIRCRSENYHSLAVSWL